MANLPKIVYNFNENDATTIRDYSENGNDGTGSGLTLSASSIVGYDCAFSGTDSLSMGNITYLNGVSAFSLHFKIIIPAFGTGGTLNVLSKSGQISITNNLTTNLFSVTIDDSIGGSFTVSDTITDGTYDVSVVMASNVLTLYVDGVSVDSDNTLTTTLATSANTMIIGSGGGTNSADFSLNEFKLYNTEITTDNIDSFIAEPNGINTISANNTEFNVGDVIGTELLDGTAKYGVVSYVGTANDFRFLPLSDNIASGQTFRRVAHLWDTTRQWGLIINDTPEICFYDLMTKSSEVFTDAKKVYCLDKKGIIKNSSTKTANYTTVSTDQRIYVDSSGGNFTITLDASPTTNKEIEIIDATGDCSVNAVTVDGNGNNIIGSATQSLNSAYNSYKFVYNGTQWNVI